MKLSVKGLAVAGAVVWAGLILLVGLGRLGLGWYGGAFLDAVASIYPGFHGATGILDLLLGTLYGLADGAIGGALIAWLYNLVVKPGVGAPAAAN